jgi:hypothetical protein
MHSNRHAFLTCLPNHASDDARPGLDAFAAARPPRPPSGIMLEQAVAVRRGRFSRITGRRRVGIDNRLPKAAKLQICGAAAYRGHRRLLDNRSSPRPAG